MLLSIALISISLFFLFYTTEENEDILHLLPDKTIAYFETQDLKKLVSTVQSPRVSNFQLRDFPSGILLALAVTDFEFQEVNENQDEAIVSLKPKFLGILKTEYWQRSNLSFVENQFDLIIRSFNGENLSRKREDGRIVWSADGEEKFFCLVLHNLILFSNDSELIEFASMQTKNKMNNHSSKEVSGLAERKSKSNKYGEKFITVERIKREREKAKDALAFAYASKDCISKLSALVAASVASFASEDKNSREVLFKTINDSISSSLESISWQMSGSEGQIKDVFLVEVEKSLTEVFKSGFQPYKGEVSELVRFVPLKASGFTRYSFQNPRLAWRSFVLSIFGNISLLEYSAITNLFFEVYGIKDAENFLDSVEQEIFVIRFDEDNSVIVGKVKDLEKLKKSIAGIDFAKKPAQEFGADVWRADELAVALLEGKVFLGNPESVVECLKTGKEDLKAVEVKMPEEIPVFTFSKSENSHRKSKILFSDLGIRYEHVSKSGLISNLLGLVDSR